MRINEANTVIRLFWTVSFALAVNIAAAASGDDFLAARDAFRAGDGVKFERYTRSLRGYVLEPYITYWRLKLHFEQATPAEIQGVLASLGGGPVAHSLRTDRLKSLAMRRQWDTFSAEYVKTADEDTELACYVLQNRLRMGDSDAVSTGRTLWLNGRDLPESCNAFFDVLIANQQLPLDELWARVRLALEAGNTGVARRVSEYLPTYDQLDARELSTIAVNPQGYLDRKALRLNTRGGRETVMFAVHRLARSAPQGAAQQWTRLGDRFSESERGYVWGQIAAQAAQRLDPSALAWYGRASELKDAELAWKVRAALRVRRWPTVLAAIDAMSPKEAQEPAWRYWKARALKTLGRGAEAQALLGPLATEFSFYGQLAAEELGAAYAVPLATYKPSRDDVQTIAKVPGIERALEFYRLNLRFEGNREWIWALRDFDDRQLLAAAELARRNELYDRAINTADRTTQLHDFSLRYLAPYRDVMHGYVNQQKLDEAWVYGLIRQESRFISVAKSGAGASGLMQLMPATARWVAQKLGLKNYQASQTNVIDTNINLGTWYLRHVYDTLDNQPVLASAAYNAGPGRARGWRGDQAMEGAIYAETIPFNETRDYVKKVMSNAAYYGHQFGHTLQSLKDRIGVIAPRSRTGESPLDEPGG